jgi:hypothetical protein
MAVVKARSQNLRLQLSKTEGAVDEAGSASRWKRMHKPVCLVSNAVVTSP